MNLAEADRRTILRAEVGSTLHGIAIGVQDDRDEMGVCVEPPEFVLGLRRFEQVVHRTQPEGVRSEPGDLDLVIYSLRKYCRPGQHDRPAPVLRALRPRPPGAGQAPSMIGSS
jgi:predicted nucleotidyltransferase